jgi:hypothetical protein
MFTTIFLGILWLLVVPFGLGIFPSKMLKKEYRFPGLILLIGYLIMMGLFECIYLPSLLLGIRFNTLCLLFRLLIGVLTLASVVFGIKDFKTFSLPKKNIWIILFAVLIAVQCVARWFQGVTDGDDAYFLGTALNAYTSNTMYYLDPYTGMATGLDMRHAFSAGGVFLAFLSNCIKLHPAITAHIIYADILLILHYICFYHIGRLLFPDKEENAGLFGCMVCVFDVFGYISIFTPAAFLLTRTWQGKSVIANICIPFVFYLLLLMLREDVTGKQFRTKRLFFAIFSFTVMAASLCMAGTGPTLLLPLLGVGSLVVALHKKKISVFTVTLPALLSATVFVVLLAVWK